jgi:hypothetical protein
MQRRQHIGDVARDLVDARALTSSTAPMRRGAQLSSVRNSRCTTAISNASVVIVYTPEFISNVF